MDENNEVQINYYPRFYAIAKKHYDLVTDNVKKRSLIESEPFTINWKYMSLDRKIHADAIVTVIFCALSLEALINAIAINSFSKSYFENHLDKLNPISKWVVIPKLLSGKELNRSGKAFELLKETFKLRNNLVHYKSRTVKLSEYETIENVTEINAERAIRSVELIAKEMKTLEPKLNIEWLDQYYLYY